MDKKEAVKFGAILSTLISIGMWIWYGTIPSFDQTKTSFSEEVTTWQNFDLKTKQEVGK